MTEDKLTTALTRAARAQALFADELLAEAFTKLEAEYIAAWRRTSATDVEGREKLWLAVNLIPLVKQHLMKVVSDGKLAQAELAMRAKCPSI